MNDALLAELEGFPSQRDQPTIEARSEYVTYEVGSLTNPLIFADRKGFQTRFATEAESISKLQEVLEAGDYFITTLYTYRSVSKALPQVKSDQPDKVELYTLEYEVLEPEIKKVRELMGFHEETVATVCGNINMLLMPDKKKDIPSDTLLDYLIRVLDMILKLDALKNMKAALNNDFSAFKRALANVQKTTAEMASEEENLVLYNFLAKTSSIMHGLRESLKRIQGFEEIIMLLIERCADNFEENRFLLCDEKHTLLRVCAFGIFLIDSQGDHKALKRLDLARFARLFKRYPTIPLYGDMSFNIGVILKGCPHFSDKEWGITPKEEQALARQYLILPRLHEIRAEFNQFASAFTIMINKILKFKTDKTDIPLELRIQVRNRCEEGIKLISSWTSQVLEQSAWKYSHPALGDNLGTNGPQQQQPPQTPRGTTPGVAQPGRAPISEYERVVRFNYSQEERAALVDMISMIKGLEDMMLRQTVLLTPILKHQIHKELQEFIQVSLRDMLARAKKKKRAVFSELVELRNLAADWLGGKAPADPALDGKKGDIPGWKVEFPNRTTGPSFTQLHMIRSIISAVVSERSPGMVKKGLKGERDFSDKQVVKLREFYNRSFIYVYLLNYNGTLRRAADLADLWYREFYLELAKRVQFPIEMSLPWLLAEDILEKRNTALMESILFPLDLYNDAAYRALFVLQRRFLFDEIESEINLVFDQLVFKLSEQIYSYFKIRASSMLLDKTFRGCIDRLRLGLRFQVPRSRYDVLLRQKHINLLGRSIDLNFLITQRINSKLRENLKLVLARFETNDLSSIIELETLLDNIKLTHYLLAEHMDIDRWEEMFAEINESVSLVSFEGHIVRQTLEELVMDFFPNFSYNSTTNRFVRSPGTEEHKRERPPRIPPHYLYGSKAYNSSFTSITDQYKNFIGAEHIQSLIRVVGQSSIALIAESCYSFIEEKLYTDLSPYVVALMEAVPPQVKLQPASYGLSGIYQYFTLMFRDILAYDDLKPGVFQCFREVGNCLAFLYLLDNCGIQQNAVQVIQAAPFNSLQTNVKAINPVYLSASTNPGAEDPDGAISTYTTPQEPFVTVTDTQSPLVVQMQQFAQSVQGLESIKNPDLLQDLPVQALRAVKTYSMPKKVMSIFKFGLERLTNFLNNIRDEWKGGAPADRLVKLDSSKEFYRMWGIFQFIFCMIEKEDEYTCFELFGDGFLWAGTAIVYLFGQQQRFEAFNFTSHVLNVNVVNDKDKGKMANFLTNAVFVRNLSTKIFNMLRAYMPLSEAQPEFFTPPDNEDFMKEKIVATIGGPQITKQMSMAPTQATTPDATAAFIPPPPPPPSSSDPDNYSEADDIDDTDSMRQDESQGSEAQHQVIEDNPEFY